MNESLQDRLQAGQYLAQHAAPYLRQALAALRLVVSERAVSQGQPTMASDRHWRTYVHPEIPWSVQEIAHVLLHEVGHLIRRHFERAEGLNPGRANIAGDCEIESHTWPAPLQRPRGGVTPQAYGCSPGLTLEAYYARLKDEDSDDSGRPGQSGEGAPDCGSAASGGARDYELPDDDRKAPGVSPVQARAIEMATADAIRSHQQANGRGSVPAELAIWAAGILEPVIDWRLVVREFFCSGPVRAGVQSLSYARARVRNQIMRPRWVARRPRLIVVTDTSSSMDGSPLQRALAEVIGLACAVGNLDVFWQDAGAEPTIQRGVRWAADFAPVGGGGTDLRPAIKAAVLEEPDGIVIVTDCDTPWDAPPIIPSLVVAVSGSPPPPWRSVNTSQ